MGDDHDRTKLMKLMQSNAEDKGGVVEGFYDWGAGIVVSADCLGQSYNTTLDGRRLVLTLPLFEPGKGTLVEPPLLFRRPEAWVSVDPPNPWGDVRSSATTADGAVIPQTVCIKRVRVKIWASATEDEDHSLGPSLDEQLEKWWVHLSSWVEVLARQDLAELGIRRPSGPRTFHLWTGTEDGTMRPLPMMFMGTFFPEVDVLTSSGLSACLAAASRQEMPPPEWLLLRDARSLHHSREWRRSVIDAATAAEISITAWLDRRLNATEEAIKSALLAPARTLGPLSNLFAKLGGDLPSEFDSQLIAPRNKAMLHATKRCIGGILSPKRNHRLRLNVLSPF